MSLKGTPIYAGKAGWWMYDQGWSNNLKFVGDCIEDVTVTCFTVIVASYQALSGHGVVNDLNSVGDS